MKWLRRFLRKKWNKREAFWRAKVHAARAPYVIYQTDRMNHVDPTAAWIPEEDNPWLN